ncbi:hypothetical protein IGI04_022948 [Brassica rapa subsp. trilocularis]|uniref:Uncharacterized protein n=1 Tax=Brassica rapa subsp. trilocularis TaxID=1813537 RepID=A0ABQ7M2E5_BRACM|nr:hypothetical protein IGI04_022948 [Brassica rapa subsp. trilocularis]
MSNMFIHLVPYRSGLVIERITAGMFRAGCGPQNAGPNPYHKTYRPSRTVPRMPPYQTAYYNFLYECSS